MNNGAMVFLFICGVAFYLMLVFVVFLYILLILLNTTNLPI